MLKVINPATEAIVKTYKTISDSEVEKQIEKAHQAYLNWRTTSLEHRAEKMQKLANILLTEKEELATLMTTEMGKLRKSAISEVEKCAWVCNYYADNAADFLADEIIETDASKSFVTFQPLGVVLAVMPWNFPLWQVFRFVAPALIAGDGGLLKHAPNVAGCAIAIQELIEKAGFPKDLFINLPIETEQVEKVIEHPKVVAATLTGSERAGSAVASLAGKHIKKTVLELGGSDAYLILADADLEKAVEACTTSRLLNNGQSCIGAKRFIVLEKVYDEFLERFTQKMKAAKMGDPMDDENDFGPMARKDLRDDLHEQVERSIAKGAKLHLGGKIPNQKGFYYPATILTEVKKGMPAFDEELFGPVAAIIRAKSEEEAIQLANDSKFGLGAAVFTNDIEKGERIAKEQLEAGCCFVNAFVKSDPRLPFGGMKTSGYGRELSHYGIKEFVNVKTVWVE
ncbi:MAG: NAD-dependent succinate-semialdehyde dehydrogenase [Bacteroidota bacterium]